MTLLTRSPAELDLDEEALIKEARQLRRRRWGIGIAITLVLLVAAFASYLGVNNGGTSPRDPGSGVAGTRPFVNAKAFRHQGILAFISRGHLWVLDGEQQTTRELAVPSGFTPSGPTLSPDGKWLSYEVSRTVQERDPVTTTEVWIARANGTYAHEVKGLTNGADFGWSPRADLLGVTSETRVQVHGEQPGQYYPTLIELVSPDGSTRRLVAVGSSGNTPLQVEGAVWSPHGTEVAVSTESAGLDEGLGRIEAYPISGGAPTTWFSIGADENLSGVCPHCQGGGTIADLAGWWPKWGIGFWAIWSDNVAHHVDQTPLDLLTAPGTTPRTIASTLSDGTTDALDVSSSGSLAVVSSTGSLGREYGQGKSVAVCNRKALTCTPLPGASIWAGQTNEKCPSSLSCARFPAPGSPGSGVSLDPNWSPDGSSLAYVKSPEWVEGYGSLSLSWYAAHTLEVWNAKTDTSQKLAKVSGVSVPTWSRDGKDLLYVSDDALWLVPADEGRPVKVESPLFPPSAWKPKDGYPQSIEYYGQIDWIGQFAWWSPK